MDITQRRIFLNEPFMFLCDLKSFNKSNENAFIPNNKERLFGVIEWSLSSHYSIKSGKLDIFYY